MEQFIDLVRKMRDAQKDYFRTRDANSLAEAKTYERKVDKMLNSLSDQKGLFDGQEKEKRSGVGFGQQGHLGQNG